MYYEVEVLKTVQAEVVLEEDVFEFLTTHLKATNMDLSDFLTLLLHSRITEMASLGFLTGASANSAQRLIRELGELDERNRSSADFSGSANFAAEELVDLDADVNPAFYQAQMRVMGTA